MLDELLRLGKAAKMVFEEEGLRKDGSIFPIEISYSLTSTDNIRWYAIIAIVQDITERKKIESALKETKEFLEKVIENTVDGIMICDLSGTVLNVNSALETMTGLRKRRVDWRTCLYHNQ